MLINIVYMFCKFKGPSMAVIMQLAFQSMGIVYGDLGTSPLYVYTSIFANGVKDNDDILGVFSLIFYTITLVTLVKYVFIVLRATDNGDGKHACMRANYVYLFHF